MPSRAKRSPPLSTLASASSDSVVSSASLAPGMKAPRAAGCRAPDGGSARTPRRRRAACWRRSIFGWYQNSIHPLLSASPSSTRAARGAAWPSLSVCMIATTAGVSNGFLSTGSICSPVLLADALDVLEHRGAAVAHELHESDIAALAEVRHGLDRLGGFKTDVEEHEVRRAAIQRLPEARAVGEFLGLDADPVQDQRQEIADVRRCRRRQSRPARTPCRPLLGTAAVVTLPASD